MHYKEFSFPLFPPNRFDFRVHGRIVILIQPRRHHATAVLYVASPPLFPVRTVESLSERPDPTTSAVLASPKCENSNRINHPSPAPAPWHHVALVQHPPPALPHPSSPPSSAHSSSSLRTPPAAAALLAAPMVAARRALPRASSCFLRSSRIRCASAFALA